MQYPPELLARAWAREHAETHKVFDAAFWRQDFLGFSALLDILPKGGSRSKLRPNAIQALFEGARDGNDIVLKPRQVGLTTWELARDIWYFVTHPGSRTVVVVQSLSDHGPLRETSEKIRVMLEGLKDSGYALDFRTANLAEWKLGDSSLRIVEAGASLAAAQKKGRSGTINRLHVTELAFFEHATETLNAMLECVPAKGSGSEVVFESTANGAVGAFFERYKAAKEQRGGYRSHFFSWLQVREYATPLEPGETFTPETTREKELAEKHGATPEQLKWYRNKLAEKGHDQALMDQEYPADEDTCWRVPGQVFFDKEQTEKLRLLTRPHLEFAAVKAATEKLRAKAGPALDAVLTAYSKGHLRLWEAPKPQGSYVLAADPSEGTGGDPGAAILFDRATGVQVGTLHGQFEPWGFGELLVDVALLFNAALIVVERNNHGHSVLQQICKGRLYPNVYRGADGKVGWNSTEISRATALDNLHKLHRLGQWTPPDARILAEMATFVVKPSGKPEHVSGAHDDLILASAIGHDVLRNPITVPYDDKFDEDLPSLRV